MTPPSQGRRQENREKILPDRSVRDRAATDTGALQREDANLANFFYSPDVSQESVGSVRYLSSRRERFSESVPKGRLDGFGRS
ncbi:hypothetical protein TBK1r_13140 [Stieleria magnilauensis]|uniref:Uncharacterized protein n=1 Tax=Stieleria magnilauensis TaxID=2527963 RepID=A0ABX5XKH4_9BACT|nr:hypothetical protein TBK1r_13140 [Planctomycetes bacterium TBK1r]